MHAHREQSQHDPLHAFFESALDAMLIADDERRYLTANPAACGLFGLSRDELLGRRIDDFVAPDLDVGAMWSTFLRSGSAEGELELSLPDGTRRVVEFRAQASFLPGKHLSVLRDITEQRRVAADRLRLLAQMELLDRVSNFALEAATDLRKLFDGVSRIVAERLGCECTLELVPNGTLPPTRPGELSIPLRLEQRTIGAMLISGCHVDDPHVLEQIAERAALAIEHAWLTQSRERLLAIVGHDLRTPLGVVRMSSEVLLMRDLHERDAEVVRRISRGAERMARTLDQLVYFHQARHGTLRLHTSPTDLQALGERIVDELSSVHDGASIELVVKGDPVGEWDRDRLAELLANLLGNAMEHGESRAPVRLEIVAGKETARIEVRNHGAPIPETLLPDLFEPFLRSLGRSNGDKHLGLGLYICREIALAHGGWIDVASPDAHGGTTFSVELPKQSPAS